MTKSNRRYQIPASTDLTLKDSLSAKLKELWTATQGSSFDLFLYAAGLRERYLDKKKDQYSPEFQEWYAKQELHLLFGKMPSFTKYAMAGKIVSKMISVLNLGIEEGDLSAAATRGGLMMWRRKRRRKSAAA